MRDDQKGCGTETWDKIDGREMDGAETPDIELIYDYSSSDSNEESIIGSQKGTGAYIQRRPLSRAGCL